MIPVSREISDLKAEFEGGSSLSVDWYGLLRRGGENLLDHINPETLKRTVPIYGGLTRYLQIYYCPADLEVPSRLYSNSEQTAYFDYLPPAQFYARATYFNNCRDKFTIEYINGVRFIVVYHPINGTILTLDEMEEVGTITGVDLTVNTYNILPGATASLQGTFTDSSYTISDDLDTALDISDLLNGVAIVPAYWDTAGDVEYVKLILKTDDSNYYTLTSTQDSVGDSFRDGQNMVRFWLANRVATGTPDSTNIASWELRVKMTTGNSQTVILGKMTIQKNALFFLEYYSNYLFVDGTTGAWKATPAAGDSINLNRDAAGIHHYETARLVMQGGKSFDTELARKYEQYYSRHPSSEMPLSYSIMPDIAIAMDPFGEAFGDFGERIGENISVDPNDTAIQYADGETPSGVFDGVNTDFYLLHTPDPAAALHLDLNDQHLAAGTDFNLVGKRIRFVDPPSELFEGLPFLASYRYRF